MNWVIQSTGGLEYHIPKQYDAKRPGFTFSTVKRDGCLNDEPCASTLPRGTEFPTVFPFSASDIDGLLYKSDSPRKLEDWIYTDRPQLDIHVVTFPDATLVKLAWLHTLMDASGRASLLKAWTAVLRGREDEVPPFHGFFEDPLADLDARPPLEWFVRSRWMVKILQWLGPLLLIIRIIWEMVGYPKYEHRMVCIPGSVVSEMREAAMEELAVGGDEGKPPFVSESDVLVAWWAQCIVRCIQPPVDKPITLLNNFNIRSTFPERFPQGTAYIGNAWLTAHAVLSSGLMLERPISYLASKLRHSLLNQRSKQQVQAYMAVQEEGMNKARGEIASWIGLSDMLIHCSNWHQARFFNVDFSSAVVSSGCANETKSHSLGKPSLIIPRTFYRWPMLLNLGSVIGKDADGNWWLVWHLKKGVWREIERQLASMRR